MRQRALVDILQGLFVFPSFLQCVLWRKSKLFLWRYLLCLEKSELVKQ